MSARLKIIVLAFVASFTLTAAVQRLAAADSAAPTDAGIVLDAATPLDAGSAVAVASGVGTGSALPAATSLPDPAEHPIAALDEAKALQHSSWAALLFGVLLMLSKALAYATSLQSVPVIGAAATWLADGKRTIYVAGFGALAAAGYNALLLGGGWGAVALAVGAVAIGWVHPTTQGSAA